MPASLNQELKLGDTTNVLNRGETITFNGQQYSTHVTMLTYFIGQHDAGTMERSLFACGSNGGMCGDDMRVLESSLRIVGVSGLARITVSQLQIVTAQDLVSTHK
jgi:hypothetical protein